MTETIFPASAALFENRSGLGAVHLKETRSLDTPLGGASPQPSGVLLKGARASRALGVRPAAHPRAGAHPARPRALVAPLLSKAGIAPKQTQCMQPQ